MSNDIELALFKSAERNDDGDLIKQVDKSRGTVRKEINVSTLFETPPRRSGNVSLLLAEARLHADRADGCENPAKPTTGAVAKEAISVIEDHELEPAWRADE